MSPEGLSPPAFKQFDNVEDAEEYAKARVAEKQNDESNQ